MANRNKHLNTSLKYEPERCWVGDTHKIIFHTREEAEMAAKVAEYDHHIDGHLSVYKCEYGDHYHLKSS